MALVEIFHVVASEKAVASGQTIKEGQIVSLDSSGEVVLVSATNTQPYGIAGDTKSTTQSYMPGVGSAVINSSGDRQNFQNRASDYFDETKASGKMTVYHSGGEFATDQFNTNVASSVIMDALYANSSGVLDTVDALGATYVGCGGSGTIVPVARLIKVDGYYPSGVPGIDINGDQALGGENSNTYVEIKLLI